MTVLDPEIVYTPPLYHRHEWRLMENIDKSPHVPAAYCQDCPETMTREQVEAILNGAMRLTDE